jgi:UDP-N-acetylmuramyl tripeptide synthase
MRKNKSSRLVINKQAAEKSEETVSRVLLAPQQQAGKSQRSPERRRSPLRAGLAIVAGRTAGALSRRLRLGGGTSVVGLVAQRVYPEIIEHLATQLEYGCVIVTGTNGKTTTSSFIASILSTAGLRVLHNKEGSNLMRGIATAFVTRASPIGYLEKKGQGISVLEIDEATLPQALQAVTPRIIAFNNLFRDQLDRYGEVDTVAARWRTAIATLPTDTILVLNADDPSIALLAEGFSGKVVYYGINDLSLNLLTQNDTIERHQVIDTRACPYCGSEYEYDVRFYSHMGHYRCPNGHIERPQPDVRAEHIQSESFDRLRVQVTTGNEEEEVVVPLPGLYNIYNALAAITTAQVLDISWEPILKGIEQFKPVFGRGESVQMEGRMLRLLLAKNPTGFNEVLRTLFSENATRHILFVLNDRIADGQDVSWIWDVDFERVVGNTATLVVTGTRARDLALRMKYAGVASEDMQIVPSQPLRTVKNEKATKKVKQRHARSVSETLEEASPTSQDQIYGLKNAIDQALQSVPVGETLFVVPTYTGLLEIHRELEQRGLAAHYWEGRDA